MANIKIEIKLSTSAENSMCDEDSAFQLETYLSNNIDCKNTTFIVNTKEFGNIQFNALLEDGKVDSLDKYRYCFYIMAEINAEVEKTERALYDNQNFARKIAEEIKNIIEDINTTISIKIPNRFEEFMFDIYNTFFIKADPNYTHTPEWIDFKIDPDISESIICDEMYIYE